MDNRTWIGKTGGLNQHVVEALLLLHKPFKALDQVAPHAAAKAAVVEFENFLIDTNHELIVDADLPEFIDDDGALVAVLLGKQMIEEGRFASSEEAR